VYADVHTVPNFPHISCLRGLINIVTLKAKHMQWWAIRVTKDPMPPIGCTIIPFASQQKSGEKYFETMDVDIHWNATITLRNHAIHYNTFWNLAFIISFKYTLIC